MQKTDKIRSTKTISSKDLDRYNGTVQKLRNVWDNLPEDVGLDEREIFIELTGKILYLHNLVREDRKDDTEIN